MKKLGLFGKIIYVLNVFVALALLFSFLLPYVPPKSFPKIAALSLLVSPLILINLLFALYWLLRFNRRFLVSVSVLFVSFFYFNSFYKFSSVQKPSKNKKLTIVSFNVRLFNAYEKSPKQDASKVITRLLKEQSPDIFCIQEYYSDTNVDFSSFKYKYVHFEGANKLGHAIFSNYPLLDKGAFDFKHSNNNALYANVLINNDTIRVYNLHLQSLGISPSVSSIEQQNKEQLIKRIGKAFTLQQEQAVLIKKDIEKNKYPTLVAGDFNNTPFSYVYRILKNDMNDAFVEAGNGLGTTYNFDNYPMRIDYIFASSAFSILSFKTLPYTSSDHFPIRAILEWE